MFSYLIKSHASLVEGYNLYTRSKRCAVRRSRLPHALWCFVLCVFAINVEAETITTLEVAIEQAIQNDPWLASSVERQKSLHSRGIAANTYPDPVLSFGVVNLPIDNFDFDQEPMTQLKVGVSQMLPRGDSLKLQKQKLDFQADETPLQRQERTANLRMIISILWLEAYQTQQSIKLIEQDQGLFEQLVAVAQLSYSSAIGKTRQQDLVRAQLELTRLEDRLLMLEQRHFAKRAALAELFPIENLGEILVEPKLENRLTTRNDLIARRPPLSLEEFNSSIQHPSVWVFEKRLSALQTDVDIAQQKYVPQWGVNASYGYRESTPQGIGRSDFFSIGMSVDLPLFTNNKQDKELSAAKSSVAALKSDKLLEQRKLYTGYRSSLAELNRLDKRLHIYFEKLLPQMSEQAESSLTAYTHNDGDFAEVMRARIAELNAKIDFLDIQIQRQKALAKLEYLLTDVHQVKPVVAGLDIAGELNNEN